MAKENIEDVSTEKPQKRMRVPANFPTQYTNVIQEFCDKFIWSLYLVQEVDISREFTQISIRISHIAYRISIPTLLSAHQLDWYLPPGQIDN